MRRAFWHGGLTALQFTEIVTCRARRVFKKGLNRKATSLLAKIHKSKKECKELVCVAAGAAALHACRRCCMPALCIFD